MTDPDFNDLIRYRLVNDANQRFAIQNNQLVVADGLQLDYETQRVHTIVVEAIDGQGLSTQQTFLITIEGVGEAPTAIRLSSIVVREDDPGAVIANVVVVDPDILDAHRIEVSDSRFEVANGVLRQRGGVSVDFEQSPFITLSLTATDNAGLQYRDTFTLSVRDVNEFSPSILPTRFSVNENATGLTLVGTVFASDADAGQTLNYRLLSGTESFAIDHKLVASLSCLWLSWIMKRIH